MAVYVPKRLAQAQPADTAETTLYTVAGGLLTIVKQIVVANTTASGVTADVSVVPVGGSAGAANRVVPTSTVPADGFLVLDLSQVMTSGDFISVLSGTGGALTYTISGVETGAIALPELGLQIADDGTLVGTRPRINFIEGANIALGVSDDGPGNKVDVTVAVSGNLGHTVKDEGTPLATRAGLNFVGDLVTVTDDAGNDETDVIIIDPVPTHEAAGDPHPVYATDADLAAAVSALVDAAPGALDTLNELAAALGDDPNFATTVTNDLATKQALSEKSQANGYASLDAGTKVPTAELGGAGADNTKYLRGDQTWAVVVSHTHDGTGGATSTVLGGTAEAGASVPVASTVGALAIGDYANAGTGTQPIAIGTGLNATSAPSATGQGAIAIGASNGAAINGARASGVSSIAIGSGTATAGQTGAQAIASNAVAIGMAANASANAAFAIGAAAGAFGAGSIAFGGGTVTASQQDAIAIGNGSISSVAQGVALGAFARAQTGTQAIAIGGGTNNTASPQANAQGAIAIGASPDPRTGARASGTAAIAIGSGDANNGGASAAGSYSMAFGHRAATSGGHSNAVALGTAATTTAANQIMLGTMSDHVQAPGGYRGTHEHDGLAYMGGM